MVGSMYPRTCDKCHGTYSHKSSFSRHLKKCSATCSATCSKATCSATIKAVNYKSSKIILIKCIKCNTVFSHKSSLIRHKKNCVSLSPKEAVNITPIKSKKCLESGCNLYFYKRTTMVKHLQQAHLKDINVREITFQSFEEFIAWKKNESSSHFSYFSKLCGVKTTNTVTYSYYTCQFENLQYRRRGSLTGSPKKVGIIPNLNCPARMLVRRVCSEVETVSVKYIASHNHRLEFLNTLFQSVDAQVRDFVDCCIDAGVNARSLLNLLRENVCTNAEIFPKKEYFKTVRYVKQLKYKQSLDLASQLDVYDAKAVSLKEGSLNNGDGQQIIPNQLQGGIRDSTTYKALNLIKKLEALVKDDAINHSLLPHLVKSLEDLLNICVGSSSISKNRSSISKNPSLPSAQYIFFCPNEQMEYQNFHPFKTKKVKQEKGAETIQDSIKTSEQVSQENTSIAMEMVVSATDTYVDAPLNPLETVIKIGPHNINTLHLKSISDSIDESEEAYLKTKSADFTRGCLYDCIIDAYLFLKSIEKPNVIVYSSTVSQYVTMTKREVNLSLEFRNVSDKDKILIPCNPSGNHWILLHYNIPKKQLEIYDPMRQAVQMDNNLVSIISNWNKVISNFLNIEWSVSSPPRSLQADFSSCGVFVCWYAEQIMFNAQCTETLNTQSFRSKIYQTLMGSQEH